MRGRLLTGCFFKVQGVEKLITTLLKNEAVNKNVTKYFSKDFFGTLRTRHPEKMQQHIRKYSAKLHFEASEHTKRASYSVKSNSLPFLTRFSL